MRAARLALVASLTLAACAAAPRAAVGTVDLDAGRATTGDPGPIPILAGDTLAGPADALATVVVFADPADPFAAAALGRLDDLAARLAPDLRVAVKILPSPFRAGSREGALAGAAVLEVGGPEAYLRLATAIAGDRAPRAKTWPDVARVPRDAVARASAASTARVERDGALAASLRVTGGPSFFVNGALCSAETRCTWVADRGTSPLLQLIDHEIGAARALRDAGTRAADIHARRCAENLAAPPAPKPVSQSSPEPVAADGTVGARHLLVQFKSSMRAAAHITRTREEAIARAEEARRKLLAGADFAAVAAEYSDEPGAAQRGGDLGTFKPAVMVPEFSKEVLELGVGQISRVFETPFGFHVVLRTR